MVQQQMSLIERPDAFYCIFKFEASCWCFLSACNLKQNFLSNLSWPNLSTTFFSHHTQSFLYRAIIPIIIFDRLHIKKKLIIKWFHSQNLVSQTKITRYIVMLLANVYQRKKMSKRKYKQKQLKWTWRSYDKLKAVL